MSVLKVASWISPYSPPCERLFMVMHLMDSSLNMDYSRREGALLTAIQQGHVERVAQLLQSGVDGNTVLHSCARRESATVLGTAAYEGQLDVLQLLIRKCRLSVNYREPWLGRCALHWACMGGHAQVVKDLLQQPGIDVNCSDRDNVTPLIMACIHAGRNLGIIQALINAGADVSRRDRLNASALHYTTDHTRNEAVVIALVLAGCVASHFVVFGHGSPLANLLADGCSQRCLHYLMAAGYEPKDRDNVSAEAAYILRKYSRPLSLKSSCRIVIRSNVGGIHLQKKMKLLPLPNAVLQYLLLETLA